jgi:hypothetical protein
VLRLAQDQDLGWWDGWLGFHYSSGIKVRDWPKKEPYWKFGGNGLWRDRLLDKAQVIYLSEGESDAVSLLDCGIEEEKGVAVLAVPGAKGFKQAWGERFFGKNVIICFDNDEPGFEGTHRTHRILAPFAAEVQSYSWKGAK